MYLIKAIICMTISIGIALSLACQKSNWYDVRPANNLVIPSTLRDLQAILDNTELLNRYSPSLGQVGSDDYYINDGSYSQLTGRDKNAYTWSHNAPYERISEWSNPVSSFGAYSRVYHCNLVLEHLTKIKLAREDEHFLKDIIEGQALFHRGRTFYELSQVFAPPYNAATAASDPGIPLRLESDISIASKRFSVKETFEQIINDLQRAYKLLPPDELPVSNLGKTRPTKAAAAGMLARVYLSIEDYEHAGEFADYCLNLYDSLIDYAAWKPVSNSRTFSVFHREVIWHTTMAEQFSPIFPPMLLIDTSLYKLYEDNDLRKSYFFRINSSTGLITFRGQYTGSSSHFCGLAVDELYLIKAECFARQGNASEAMKYLNDLLRVRWRRDSSGNSMYSDQIAADAVDALKRILNERRKELLLRGLRWSDLRRLNKDDRFMTQIRRVTPDGVFNLEPNGYNYTYPIPDDIIAISAIPQNPGW
jgi:starch-binding outer membrane protein, SusD/RagB family